MAKGSDTIYLVDGSFDFSEGVDSSKPTTIQSALNPNGLHRSQLAWLNNASVRGGSILQRTGWQPLLKVLDAGRWQGGYIYEPDGENPYLVCSISGIIYSVLLETPFTVTDLTGGNPALVNPNTEMVFFCQAEKYLVIQAGDFFVNPVPTLPLFWDGTTLRRSIGIVTATPTVSAGQNEIPAATCMDYYGGRIFYAQARQYSAGDMVGGPSGTLANRYRDSVLSVTENPLCFGGDGFTVPTNAGNIRAIKHSANINAVLGQGQLYIFTRKSIYQLTVPQTRTDWINADANNQPKQDVVQLVNGAVGDRCVVPINGDLYYQSFDPAVRSLIRAQQDFTQPGNTPISQNEERALQFNNRGLMRFSSGIEFNNRILMLALPRLAGDGVNVVHDAILPLDFDVVTNFQERKAPAWEGAYDGLPFLQLFAGDFGGLPRAFGAVISDIDGSINIWELTTSSRTEDGDKRVTWSPEFPAFTWAPSGLEFKLKQLVGGECWIDKISGTVEMDVYYREDADPCWRRWFHTSFCAARCEEQDPPIPCPAYPVDVTREGYKFPVVFPAPKGSCDSMGIRPSTIGYQFQCKIVLKGWCRIKGLLLYALPHSEPQYHGVACPTTGGPVGMAKLPNPFS